MKMKFPNLIQLIHIQNNMNKEIILEKRSVYGNDLIYPSCHIANALIKLKDKKTFKKSDLEVFKALGLIITWKAGKV